MAKVASKKTATQKKTADLTDLTFIPEKYQDLVFVVLIALAVFVFFASAIFGNGFSVSDSIASHSFQNYIDKADKSGKFPLWVPYIFSGMPSFGSMLTSGARIWDIIPTIFFGIMSFVGKLFASDLARMVMYYIIYGWGMYLLMRSKNHERFVSFFSAMAAVFSTCVIIWVMIGHNTKPVVFATFPFIFLLLERLREKFSLIYAMLLVIVMHLMMEGAHLQMIFYGACAFGLYLLFELISRLIRNEQPLSVLRAAVVLVIAGGLAFAMSADRYLSTAEYTKYSTRGSAPLVKTNKNAVDEKGGNTYDYATMWSFSPGETMTFFVPNFYGFGKQEYSGPETNNQAVKAPVYWGQKPFDDAAPYMGIGVLWLAVIGFLLYRKDVFVQFLFALSIFSLLLSFGRNFSVVYDIFFYYFPGFNKFRAPSMALALIQFAVPVLAGYGLTGIMRWRKEMSDSDKKMLVGALISAGAFLVIGFLFSVAFKSSYISAVERSGKEVASKLSTFVWDSMISDWYMTAFVAIISMLFVYLFVNRKLSFNLFAVLFVAVLVFDLWRVGYRPMEVSSAPIEKEVFTRTDLVNFLEQDKSKFRIADLSQESSPNVWAYWGIETVNGYHSAKLRVYQDLMDNANLENAKGSTSIVYNPFLWNLMNVKYYLTSGPMKGSQPIFQSQMTGQAVYPNPEALPRAFFVKKAEVHPEMEIVRSLEKGDFNPRDVAYFEKALPVQPDTMTVGTSAELTDYQNEYMKFNVKANGNNLLFISEIWYPEGWNAYLDGKQIDVYKANYAFRSVIVPAGTHTLEMKFSSKAFEKGKSISLIANIFTLIGIGLGLFLVRKEKKTKE